MTILVCFDLQKGANVFDNPAQANGLRRLAQGVIIQAAREARNGSLEAAAWLADPETGDTWLTLAGVDRRAVLSWVADGCKKGLRKTTKTAVDLAKKQGGQNGRL